MDESIYEQNRLLQRKLDHLLKQARANEKKQELYEAFGFEIIGANTPKQLRDLLLSQIIARFQLHDAVLCLVDHHKDIERLFFDHDEEARLNFENKLLILDTLKDAEIIQSLINYPMLGSEVLRKYRWMTDNLKNRDQIKSAAFLPLLRSDQIIGALLLISHDVKRYQQDAGTFFLQKLSAMIAVAIENCLNQQRIKEVSYQDVLTQAYNRRYFDLRFKDEIARATRWNDDLICMFLDVDHFKTINDTYGHQTGDLVLKRMTTLIKEQVRACDIVARYGGEEFVVALPTTMPSAAYEIAERLRQAICLTTLSFHDKQFKVSISIGMANLKSLSVAQPYDTELICATLLDRADKALYNAKAGGRNQVSFYTNSTNSTNSTNQ